MQKLPLLFYFSLFIGFILVQTSWVKPIPVMNKADFSPAISDTPCIPETDTLDGQKVYRKVEKPAEFPGGQSDLVRYFQRNLRYPTNQDDMQSIVRITFVVDTFGNLRNLCVINNLEPNYLSPFDSAALTMFQNMPNWVPAELNKRKVYFRHIQAINVHLE